MFDLLGEEIVDLSKYQRPVSKWVYLSIPYNNEIFNISLYIRKKILPDYTTQFVVANILINIQGKGLGTLIVDYIESFLSSLNLFDSINYESVINDRFLTFLEKKGYTNLGELEFNNQLYKKL